MLRGLLGLTVLCSLTAQLAAADLLPPANERFARPGDEVPDLQRHVLPLLGRLGCNGRACHGSFQGQGGFRLSLFGYDFQADHQALVGGDEPRINPQDPAASLILQKPSLAIDHEGGQRFKPDGWEHQLLLRWIKAKAPGVADSSARLVALELEPQEIKFSQPGETEQLQVIARWDDGTREDVTPLSRFRSNDESIATVNEAGLITSVGKGDTHIVAFYDNGTLAVPVALPLTDLLGARYPAVPTPTRIDELVVAKLRTLGIVPSQECTDGEFLRRVSLDMTGTLPRAEDVTAFLADSSPTKRAQKIEELLSRPTYAAWWTTKLCDLTGNSERNLPEGGEQGLRREKSEKWYDWIYRRVEQNVAYDKLVQGMVLAVSRAPGQSDAEYFTQMSAHFRQQDPHDFAARETMPYFWTNNRFTPPQPLRFSFAFLGVRLECAQCHKHPYDQWTKDDFDQFQIFFEGVRQSNLGGDLAKSMKHELGLTADQDSGGYKRLFAKLAADGKVVPWQELVAPNWKASGGKIRRPRNAPAGRVITPKLLGGEEVIAEQYSDPREPLMEWLRDPANPYFARAIVNRVWANYFGVGIVEPADDMNLANPPSNAPLLDYLATEFVAQGYDLKWLHRTIASSRTYQLSWRPNDTNRLDERNFSHARVRRLPAEVMVDVLRHATASEEGQRALHEDRAVVRGRAIGVSSGFARAESAYPLKLFGKPERSLACECERSSEPSLLQTIYLRNDGELASLLERKDGWLQEISRPDGSLTSDPSDLVRQAYLRAVGRAPSEAELAIAQEHLAQAPDARSGLKDLLWALLNTKEFSLNH